MLFTQVSADTFTRHIKQQRTGQTLTPGHTQVNCLVESRISLGFGLVELLVTMAIVAFLAILISPVLQKSFEGARSAKCLSNLKQIGMGILNYTTDNNGVFPAFQEGTYTTWEYVGRYEQDGTLGDMAGWGGHIYPYLGGRGNWKVFVCPSDPHAAERNLTDYTSNGGLGTGASYSLNAGYIGAPRGVSYNVAAENSGAQSRQVRITDLQWPSQTCLVADDSCRNVWPVNQSRPVGLLYAPWSSAVYHPQHSGGLNVLYCDGHVAPTSLDFFRLNAQPARGTPAWRFWFVKSNP